MLDAAVADQRFDLLRQFASGDVPVDEVAEDIAGWLVPDPVKPSQTQVWADAEVAPADAPEGFGLVRAARDYGILSAAQYDAINVALDDLDDEGLL